MNSMETKSDYERYKKASEKVQEIKGFYSHLIAYLLVIPLFIVINFKFTPGHYWFFYPMIGWGVGVFFHALGVFDTGSFFGKGWEERKLKQFIKEEEEKLKNNQFK